MSIINKFLIEGLDRLGKDTLIAGIQNKRGFHQEIHFQKPKLLDCYGSALDDEDSVKRQQHAYQMRSFRTMFSLLRDATYSHLIMNRAHLGECVYAPMYRGYSGEYVFQLERDFGMAHAQHTRLILLTENFRISKHFVDDGMSLGTEEKRSIEQDMFIDAFGKSCIPSKRIVCVTGLDGKFRPPAEILEEVLA